MISEDREPQPRTPTLIWALLASALIHALVLPVLLRGWSQSVSRSEQPREREIVIASTAARIETRPVPRPPSLAAPASSHKAAAPSRPALARAPAAPRHELARQARQAPPQPAPKPRRPAQTSFERQLAEQRAQFAREVARLRRQNDPLSIATRPTASPAAFRRSYFDVPGRLNRPDIQALLFPLRHWVAGDASCYYVRYVAQFSTGGHEDGVIPWPVCYPVTADRIAHPPFPHALPIPVPQPDYVLPAGTPLTPLLRTIYDRRPSPG